MNDTLWGKAQDASPINIIAFFSIQYWIGLIAIYIQEINRLYEQSCDLGPFIGQAVAARLLFPELVQLRDDQKAGMTKRLKGRQLAFGVEWVGVLDSNLGRECSWDDTSSRVNVLLAKKLADPTFCPTVADVAMLANEIDRYRSRWAEFANNICPSAMVANVVAKAVVVAPEANFKLLSHEWTELRWWLARLRDSSEDLRSVEILGEDLKTMANIAICYAGGLEFVSGQWQLKSQT